MKVGAPGSLGAQLKALREAAGYTQEELATIAGLSVHAVSALERGERRRPHVETMRALSAALDLTPPMRDAFVASARAPAHNAAVDELSAAALPRPLTSLLGRDRDVELLQLWLADPGGRPDTDHRAGRRWAKPVWRWSLRARLRMRGNPRRVHAIGRHSGSRARCVRDRRGLGWWTVRRPIYRGVHLPRATVTRHG
jgi:transcriptional regulator with XRE-family HTH domain